MGLGFCCCGCTWLNDLFACADTSGTDPARLGPNWTVVSGDWQIVSGALTVSAASSVLKCNLGASGPSPAQFIAGLAGTFPAGSFFRIFNNNAASGNHVRWTPNDTIGSPHTGRVRVVGTQTADIANLNVNASGPFFMCRSKNVAGNWILGAYHNNSFFSGYGGWPVGAFIGTPSVNTFTLEVVNTPSPITITNIAGTTLGTAKCPGNCDSNCPVFCENAKFSLTISGWQDTPAGPNTDPCPPGQSEFPEAICSCINGTYLFDNTDNPDGACSWSKGYPSGCGTDFFIGPAPPAFSLSYNPATNKTTVTINGWTKDVDGQLDCVNGFEAITITGTNEECLAASEGCPPVTLSTVTYTLTGLGGG